MSVLCYYNQNISVLNLPNEFDYMKYALHMSGHSKWAQIKRQKGVTDKKRGMVFTKLANAISIIVGETGNGDIESNFRLKMMADKARAANMPKENIHRAIDKGLGKGDKGDLQEVAYEGFGPVGIAVIVECVTDNKLRIQGEVTNIFNKNGGTLGKIGSVSYQFNPVGMVTIKKDGKNMDDIFLLAVDAGATDVEEAGEEVIVYTNPAGLKTAQENLIQAGFSIIEAELSRKPTITVSIADKESADRVLSFIEKLENLDDVQKVYANFDIPDSLVG